MDVELLESVRGGTEIIAWYGFAPSFHYAEIIRLELNREGTVCRFDVWHWNWREEIHDSESRYVYDHGLIAVELWGVTEIELHDFNHQNVILEFTLAKLDDGTYRIDIERSSGLWGHICAREICFGLMPGLPPDRVKPTYLMSPTRR